MALTKTKGKTTSTLTDIPRPRIAPEHEADPTMDSLQLLLREAGRYPLLKPSEEIELAKRIEKGDLAAKDRMINSNLRLVVANARRYQGQGLALGDLIGRDLRQGGRFRAGHRCFLLSFVNSAARGQQGDHAHQHHGVPHHVLPGLNLCVLRGCSLVWAHGSAGRL
jgi:hypothetical protein